MFVPASLPQVSLACHPTRPILGVCYLDGVVQLCDISKLGKDESGAAGGVAYDTQTSAESGDDALPLPTALASALLPPLVTLKVVTSQTAPVMSCLNFHSTLDLLAAGGPGKERSEMKYPPSRFDQWRSLTLSNFFLFSSLIGGCMAVWNLTDVKDGQTFNADAPLNSAVV